MGVPAKCAGVSAGGRWQVVATSSCLLPPSLPTIFGLLVAGCRDKWQELIEFIFEKVGAHRVPTSPKGIRGPEGARRKEKFTKWNRAKYV